MRGPLNSKLAFFNSHQHRNKIYTTYQYHENKNTRELIALASNAGFPNKIINKLFKNSGDRVNSNTNQDQSKVTFTSPIDFNPTLVPVIKYIRRKFNIHIPFKAPRSISTYVKNDRDYTPFVGGVYCIPISLNNVIYKYIGQTTRSLDIRLKEHKKSLSTLYNNTSLKEFIHSHSTCIPQWEQSFIISAPHSKNLLIWQEAFHILSNNNTINSDPGRKIAKIWQPSVKNDPMPQASLPKREMDPPWNWAGSRRSSGFEKDMMMMCRAVVFVCETRN